MEASWRRTRYVPRPQRQRDVDDRAPDKGEQHECACSFGHEREGADWPAALTPCRTSWYLTAKHRTGECKHLKPKSAGGLDGRANRLAAARHIAHGQHANRDVNHVAVPSDRLNGLTQCRAPLLVEPVRQREFQPGQEPPSAEMASTAQGRGGRVSRSARTRHFAIVMLSWHMHELLIFKSAFAQTCSNFAWYCAASSVLPKALRVWAKPKRLQPLSGRCFRSSR